MRRRVAWREHRCNHYSRCGSKGVFTAGSFLPDQMIRLESFNIFPFGPFCVRAALLHTAGLSLHPYATDSFTTLQQQNESWVNLMHVSKV